MSDEHRDFYTDLNESNKKSDSKEVFEVYEKKLQSKISDRIKITNRKQQKKGYDLELYLDDGRILTIEEKIRDTFFPDILLEVKHENSFTKVGWLYTSEAEILAYFQPKGDSYYLSLWKLKELAIWSKSNEFLVLLNEGTIKERWSQSKKGDKQWRTQNYVVPFHILKDKGFEYRNKKYEKNKSILPLEFFNKPKHL